MRKLDPILSGDAALGAAALLTYLRDCLTVSSRDVWPREDLLVLLEAMTRDYELFDGDIAVRMWNVED